MAGLYHFGGYILHKIYRNLNCLEQKSENNQQAMEILLSIRSTEQRSIATFVDELSRGGLWKITEDMEKIFLITEKYFSVQTAETGIREISIPTLVDNLIKFPPLSLAFHHMVSECNTSVNEGVEINLLSSILTLFLRVRTFPFTKDIVTKKKRKIANDEALRKSAKKASKNETLFVT